LIIAVNSTYFISGQLAGDVVFMWMIWWRLTGCWQQIWWNWWW